MKNGALLLGFLFVPVMAAANPCDDCDGGSLRRLADDVGRLGGMRVISSEKLDVKEPSGVTVLPDGRLLIADDDRGVYVHTPGGETKKWEMDVDGSEGITLAGDGKSVFVVAEKSGAVREIEIEGSKREAGDVKNRGELPSLGDSGNKGWEGLATLPARLNPEKRARLVAVHEGKPRRVVLFDPRDPEKAVVLELPKKVADELKDLSDVAVDPRTGHLFLISQESSKIAEVELRMKDGELDLRTVDVRKLPFEKSLRPEGLAFATDGTLWIVTEGDRRLRRISF